jgi:hypothetical protein
MMQDVVTRKVPRTCPLQHQYTIQSTGARVPKRRERLRKLFRIRMHASTCLGAPNAMIDWRSWPS